MMRCRKIAGAFFLRKKRAITANGNGGPIGRHCRNLIIYHLSADEISRESKCTRRLSRRNAQASSGGGKLFSKAKQARQTGAEKQNRSGFGNRRLAAAPAEADTVKTAAVTPEILAGAIV